MSQPYNGAITMYQVEGSIEIVIRILDDLEERISNSELDVASLRLDKATIGKDEDSDNDIELDVLGDVAINGNLDASNIQVLNMVVGNETTNSDVSFIQTNIYISDKTSSTDGPPYSLTIDSSNAILLPRGGKLDDGSDGAIRYNTEDKIFEGYSENNWRGLGGVRSIDGKTYVHADNSGVLDFFTKNESQMFIDACGNIGIGLNDNESLLGGDIKLDVSGDVNLSGNVTFDSSYGILLPEETQFQVET